MTPIVDVDDVMSRQYRALIDATSAKMMCISMTRERETELDIGVMYSLICTHHDS